MPLVDKPERLKAQLREWFAEIPPTEAVPAVIHKPIEGLHEPDETCWCCPTVIYRDEFLTPAAALAHVRRAERLN